MDPNISRKFIADGQQPVFLLGEVTNAKGSTNLQDFYKIRKKCEEDRKLFEDSEFPADMKSLYYSRAPPNRPFVWLRPSEISQNPQFSIDDFTRFDVQQGEIGDCWFLAAVACLTQDPKLLSRVVCADNSFKENYAGIFHFRFWQYGKWVDVVIDDRLPTVRGKLFFMHSSNKNEFWSALLEKAYAKLYGSYESLRGGFTSEALEDFTGGMGEAFYLKNPPDNLFNIIVKSFQRGSLMGCSITPDKKIHEARTAEGLVRGHAYSVTKVQVLEISSPFPSQKIELIRLRNPWGNEIEWQGAWSDRSNEWRQVPNNVKAELGLTISNDGEFWMSFQDFLKYFDDLDICHLSPESLEMDDAESEKSYEKEWILNSFEGEWVAGISAGGCRNYADSFPSNPQFIMTLQDPDEDDDEKNCTVIISLMQKNRRVRRNVGVKNLSIGFTIFKVSEENLKQKPLKTTFFKSASMTASSEDFQTIREVCYRFQLPPSSYVILPSTFRPNENGEFLMRVFTEGTSHLREHDNEMIRIREPDGKILVEIPEKSETEKIFKEIGNQNLEIGWMELKKFLKKYLKKENKEKARRTSKVNGNTTSSTICSCNCPTFSCGNLRFWSKFRMEWREMTQDLVNKCKRKKSATELTGFSNEVCRSLVALMDSDRSGKLGLDESHALLGDILKWKAVFQLYDVDHTNRLEVQELQDAFKALGYHLNKTVLNEIAFRYGSSDLSISFDDFVLSAIKLKTMLHHFKEKDRLNVNRATFTLNEWIKKSMYS